MKHNAFHLRFFLAAIFLSACSLVEAQTSQDTVYVFLNDLPDGGVYLPPPPDTASQAFATDFLTWQYGKTIRPTDRGRQASIESLWTPEENIRVTGEALGLSINKETTPAIWHFLHKVARTGDFCTKAAKEKYMRIRPFARMNEHTWAEFDDEEFLRTNGSYPSGHTAMGWITALAAAEIAPELQDTILRRGYMFGENRWIVGAHWKSDVDAGYLCASAAFARAHANPTYYTELEAARAEYKNLREGGGVAPTKDGEIVFPDGLKILPQPVDTASYLYFGDLAGYYEGKALRDSLGDRVKAGVSTKVPDIMAYFADSVDVTISQEATPALFALLNYSIPLFKQAAHSITEEYFRKRPFVQLAEASLIPEKEEAEKTESSYPSGHSTRGWGMALILTEIMPQCQNGILTKGYEYGYNRVITGYHYLSDVQAARLVAAFAIARLHSDETFMTLLQAAKTEYQQKKSTALNRLSAGETPATQNWYSVTGQNIGKSKPQQTGVYIHDGEKQWIR